MLILLLQNLDHTKHKIKFYRLQEGFVEHLMIKQMKYKIFNSLSHRLISVDKLMYIFTASSAMQRFSLSYMEQLANVVTMFSYLWKWETTIRKDLQHPQRGWQRLHRRG